MDNKPSLKEKLYQEILDEFASSAGISGTIYPWRDYVKLRDNFLWTDDIENAVKLAIEKTRADERQKQNSLKRVLSEIKYATICYLAASADRMGKEYAPVNFLPKFECTDATNDQLAYYNETASELFNAINKANEELAKLKEG